MSILVHSIQLYNSLITKRKYLCNKLPAAGSTMTEKLVAISAELSVYSLSCFRFSECAEERTRAEAELPVSTPRHKNVFFGKHPPTQDILPKGAIHLKTDKFVILGSN